MHRDLQLAAISLAAFGVCWTGAARAQSVALDASHVFLRQDCGAAADCFESLDDLQVWLWQTRTPAPSSASPVLVDIGPGEFRRTQVGFECPDGMGHVTLRGSGREATTIANDAGPGGPLVNAGVRGVNCDSLEVQDLHIEGTFFGVKWEGGGSSTWNDVDVFGVTGWYDTECGAQSPYVGPPLGVHYWFGSRIAGSLFGYVAYCGESWIYGSEVKADSTGSTYNGGLTSIGVSQRADVRLFGTAVRLVATPEAENSPDPVAVRVGQATGAFFAGVPLTGTFHMHGGIISADASQLVDANLTALSVDVGAGGTALAHTPDTAFALKGAANGSVTRVELLPAGASVSRARSPFLWEASPSPPGPDLRSVTGLDMFVETDCDAAGSCANAGSETHLMIYNDQHCPSTNPWFDVVTGACRQ